MEYLRYKPVALWKLDDTAPFQDYSGYNRSGTLTGTESFGASISAYTTLSHRFSNTSTATFASPVYVAGREDHPFSLAVSVYPIRPATATDASQQILSNLNLQDGITIEGTKISFSTKYVNTGEARCSYDMQVLQKADVVAVHTATKNILYINGVFRAEVDITPEQQADTYDAPNSNLYSGGTSQSAGLLLNTVALYSRPLLAEEVTRLYEANNKRAVSSVPKMFGGQDVFVSTTARPGFLNTGWFTDADWQAAQMEGCVPEDGQLISQMVDGLTTGGIWSDSIDLYVGEVPVVINSVNLFWYGENITVQASVDDVNWVDAERGVNLSNIPTGFDPTGKDLFIKVIFAEGEETSYIDSLQVRGYLTDTGSTLSGRSIVYTNPIVALDEYPAAEMRENWGALLLGGSLTVSAEPVENEEPLNPQTIEIWVKQGSGAALAPNFSATTSYINGLVGSPVAPVGEWALIQFVLAAPHTGDIVFDGDVQIGKIGLYPTAITADEALVAYSNYIAVPTLTRDGSGTIDITESVPAVRAYGYDWEIVAA